MAVKLITLLWTALAAYGNAAATVQGNCTKGDHGLRWLASVLSPESVISCRGQPLQLYNAGRYWGLQYAKNASVVVFPSSSKDVSFTVQATSRTPLGEGYTFVSGGHGQTNASSSYSFIIDLSYMNKTRLIHDYKLSNGSTITAIAYQGGATWAQVVGEVAGSGYIPVSARVGNVGVGGFSTGGGIGFLANAYGFATDRLVEVEVVLSSGDIVTANWANKHSDLFWALHGGNGQFGIVTEFHQHAAPEPPVVDFGFYYVSDAEVVHRMQKNTADFFETNTDPFSLMYYSIGWYPQNLTAAAVADENNYGLYTIVVAIRFSNPLNPSQKTFNATFSKLLKGITPTYSELLTVPYGDITDLGDSFFPYGFRRGFFGPQVTKISAKYLNNLTTTFSKYISHLRARGENPVFALFNIQYAYPGLNGNLPASNSATAWPHAVSTHQTLFSPAWNYSRDDALTEQYNKKLNQITYDRQVDLGEFVADYPNYISPDVTGQRVFGDNLPRLERIKQKYDPECALLQGRVFGSKTCKKKGRANL